MFTTDVMDRYIEQAAHSYLKEGKPLDDTITKIASDNGLNADQIARVAEGANTEVYVQLMNQSTDKYVQFPNASAEKIAEAVHGTEKKAEIITNDYDQDPDFSGDIQDSVLEKVASEEERPLDFSTVRNEAIKLAGLHEQIGNTLDEVDVRFQQNSDVLYFMLKQAYLAGTSFGDLRSAITSVYDSPILPPVIEECREKLAAELDPIQVKVDENNHGSVNSENPIIKQAGILVKDAEEFITLREKRAEIIAGMEKVVGMFPEAKPFLKEAGNALSTAKKVAIGLGVGAVGGMGFEHHLNTYKKNQAEMPMKTIAPQFVR
jgi:hypothetical protein